MLPSILLDPLAALARRTPYVRGKQRLLEWLAPRRGARDATIHGVRMRLDLGELIQRQVFLGYYEHEEIGVVRDWLRAGDTFVDIGANIGYFSAMAHEAVGTRGRVVAFEPYPPLAARLTATFVDRPTVTVVESALGEAPGSVTLHVPPPSWGNVDPSVVAYAEGMTPVDVGVRTLADECARLGVGRIRLAKLDVEGYEPEVLLGARPLFEAGRIDAVFIEMNGPLLGARGRSVAELDALLASVGLHEARRVPTAPARGACYNALYVRGSTA